MYSTESTFSSARYLAWDPCIVIVVICNMWSEESMWHAMHPFFLVIHPFFLAIYPLFPRFFRIPLSHTFAYYQIKIHWIQTFSVRPHVEAIIINSVAKDGDYNEWI